MIDLLDRATTATQTRSLVTGGDPHERFPIPDDGPWAFACAPRLEGVGEALIAECSELAHLAGVPIGYLWKRTGGKKRGWCQKSSGLLKFYALCDFLVWIAADHARDAGLTRWQMEALIFHELSFADVETDEETGLTKPVMRSLEVEAWSAEIARYGDWSPSLGQAKRAFAQLGLGLG